MTFDLRMAHLGSKRLPEKELLRRAVAGEDLAVRQLLLPYLAQLSRIIANKYPNLNHGMATVDDVIQETFTESLRHIQEFDPQKGSLRSWLATIADRRAMRAVRDAQRVKRGGKQKRAGQVLGEETSLHNLVEMLSAGSHTASRSAMRHEAVEAVHDVISDLPVDYQQAVQLYLIDGKTLQEAAVLSVTTF